MVNDPKNDKDKTDDAKAADIERWFQALGDPPEAPEPPGARLRMLARIDQMQQRRWRFDGFWTIPAPALATGLAALLLLSVGLNVWWGQLFFGLSPDAKPQVADSRAALTREAFPLSTYRFQDRLQDVATLGPLLASRTPDAVSIPIPAFAPRADQTPFFRMGILYTSALAAGRGGAADIVQQRLQALTQTLVSVQAPAELSQYLRELQTRLHEQPEKVTTWTLLLAGFESQYRDAYAASPLDEWVLWQIGAWSENMYLAAALKDRTALAQTHAIPYFQHALGELNAPPRTVETLAQVQHLVANKALTEDDLDVIRNHLETIQATLSE